MKVTKGIGLVSSDEIRSEYRNWGENDAQMRQSQFINLYMNMILNYRQISKIKDQISNIKGTQYDKRYTLESIPDIEYKRHPNVVKWSLLGKYENDGIERVELTLRCKWLR